MPALFTPLQLDVSREEMRGAGVIKDAELNLLVALCASAIKGERCRETGEDLDWQRLVQLARRHRVQGFAWLGLTGGIESDVGHETELFEEAKSIAQDNLVAIAAAVRLREEFRNDGLQIIFLKGLTLGALAYRQSMLKLSTDVDVLIEPAEIEAVEQCLYRLGYRPEGRHRLNYHRASVRKEWTWIGNDGVQVDLHTRLADNPEVLATLSASSPTREVQVSPGISLPTLQREQLFAYLCVHGASSAWFRLKWVADLAALISGCSADEISELYVASQSLGAGRAAEIALLVAEQLFGPLVPRDVISCAARDHVSRVLTALSLHELERLTEPLERPFGTLRIHFIQMFIGRGIGFPLREFGRQLVSRLA